MRNLTYQPAYRLVEALAAGEISAREVLDAHLARLAEVNPLIGAVPAVDIGRAARQAARADAARARDRSLGPLHGLPVLVRAGLAAATAAPDGVREPVAAWLRRAGAVVLATTARPPSRRPRHPDGTACPDHAGQGWLAMDTGYPTGDTGPAWRATHTAFPGTAGGAGRGRCSGDIGCPWPLGDAASTGRPENAGSGVVGNPWDAGRGAGSAAGWTAAAVAAGLAPLALGVDGAGATRTAAHYCGVCAHRWSGGGGSAVLPPAGPAGWAPVARSARDLHLLLGLPPGPRPGRPPRVAYWSGDPAAPAGDDVRERVAAAVSALRDAGVEVVETRPPLPAGRPAISAGPPPEGPSGRPSLALYRERSAAGRRDRDAAADRRRAAAAGWTAFFTRYDVLLTPAAPTPAPPRYPGSRHPVAAGRRTGAPGPGGWAKLAVTGDLAATVVPAGLTGDGLPAGVQLLGPPRGDGRVLAVAVLLEDLLPPEHPVLTPSDTACLADPPVPPPGAGPPGRTRPDMPGTGPAAASGRPPAGSPGAPAVDGARRMTR
ncbi:hypothetical protein Sru01_15380 [Sphaerisporangium rufum]|uniref:Amidase domain-containing protein n=1 Tax=Sphaerisporangium rufum TaxID=1381558 RepID=A0A919UX13_9ACTN|nr:amidase family protein [Sphaerisporangium rufum]GII76556.1 hypothetical protein Sru01_15380 [Sphaerisporangium rufum]